jgi:hypothetical protein|tara:strand:- start:21531 stop:23570 length:2040 start_codon:yes stop_codon:yes gene_type:complete
MKKLFIIFVPLLILLGALSIYNEYQWHKGGTSALLGAGTSTMGSLPAFRVDNSVIVPRSKSLPLGMGGASGQSGVIRFLEDSDFGSNFTALQATSSIASNVTYTLPPTDGTSGQVIQTDGNGILSFVTHTVSGFTEGSTLFAGSTGEITEDNANFFWDDTNDRLGIGIGAPTANLHIEGSATDTTLQKLDGATNAYTGTSAYQGYDVDMDISTSGGNAFNVTGMKFDITNTHGSDTGIIQVQDIAGMDFDLTLNSTFENISVFAQERDFGMKFDLTNTSTFTDSVMTQKVYGYDSAINSRPTFDGAGMQHTLETYGMRLFVKTNPTFTAGNSLNVRNYGVSVEAIGTTVGSSENYGYYIHDLTGGDDNYGFYINDSDTGSNVYGLYFDPDIQSIHRGQFKIGDTTDPDAMLEIVADATSSVGLHIKGAASQTGALMTMTDSSDNVFFNSGDGLAGSEVVWNEQQADIDFKVHGDGLSHMIHVDASTDRIGIGIETPNQFLDVRAPDGANSTAFAFAFRNLDTTNGQGQGVLIQAGNGTSDYPLGIRDRAGTDLFRVVADGKVGIGTITPSSALSMGDDDLITRDVNAGLTASTTQSQGQGALTAEINEVATVGNANDVVTLPTAVAGYKIVIINNGANTLQIFPASGDDLGAGVDTSTTLASGSNVQYVSYDATNWEAI